jgi:hypothetical protein
MGFMWDTTTQITSPPRHARINTSDLTTQQTSIAEDGVAALLNLVWARPNQACAELNDSHSSNSLHWLPPDSAPPELRVNFGFAGTCLVIITTPKQLPLVLNERTKF